LINIFDLLVEPLTCFFHLRLIMYTIFETYHFLTNNCSKDNLIVKMTNSNIEKLNLHEQSSHRKFTGETI